MAKSKIERMLGLQLGLEDDDVITTGDQGEILNGEETVEGELLDVVDETGIVEDAGETVEELADAGDNLEEVATAMESIMANGGLDRNGAVMARLAVKFAVGKRHQDLVDLIVPSMENFSGSNGRLKATTLTMETIKDTLKAFWNKLVAQMKKFYNYVKGWVLKVMDAAPKLKARAEAIAKKSGNITGNAEEKKITIGSYRQLAIGKTVPNAAALIGAVKHLAAGADKILGESTAKTYEELTKTFEETLAKDKVVDSAEVVKNLKALARNLGNTMGAGTPESGRFGTDVTIDLMSATLPGNMAVFATASADTSLPTDRIVRLGGYRLTSAMQKTPEVDGSAEVETLDTSAVRSLCDEVVDICNAIIQYRKSWEKRDAYSKKVESAGNKAINDAEKNEEGDHAKIVRQNVGGMMASAQKGLDFETQFIKYLLQTGNGLMVYCERSLAQYK